MIIFDEDVATLRALHSCPRRKEPWVAPFNPTAENMADYILRTVCPQVLADTAVAVTKVVVWETPNCCAEASLGEFVHQ
jgi:6-pyruvoyltetrahydropterin/6-carboxytetrahydropterin synthase